MVMFQDVPPGYQVPNPDRHGHRQLDVFVGLDDGCEATVRLVLVDDVFRVRRVEILSRSDAGEVTTATLRGVRLGDIRLQVFDDVRADPRLIESPIEYVSRVSLDEPYEREVLARSIGEDFLRREDDAVRSATAQTGVAARNLRKGPSRGRGAQSPSHYRDTALLYIGLLPSYGQRVIKEMAQRLDRPRNTISTWVRRAREDGWLTRSTQGKAGGEPGPRLIAWLNEQEDDE